MSRSQAPKVRLERQPHRHAVLRLRQVYHKLWQSQQQVEVVGMATKEKPKPKEVQEVLT